jgi:hypothetical protein
MTTAYWQLRSAEYLQSELREEGSTAPFRLPDDWWLTSASISSGYKPLVITAGRTVAEPPDFVHHDVLPLVSDRCRRILESHGGYRGEFHLASLILQDGSSARTNPYWYFRLFDRVDAINNDESEIEFFPGTRRPKRVWRLQLTESALHGHEVFRLEKIEAIFVSQELRAAMQAAGLHIHFSAAEEFRLGW